MLKLLLAPVIAFVLLFVLQGLISEGKLSSAVAAYNVNSSIRHNRDAYIIPAQSGNLELLSNNGFDTGLSPWLSFGTVIWRSTDGNPGGNAELSQLYTSAIQQSFTAVETGIYQLSLDCESSHWYYWVAFEYRLESSNPDVPATIESVIACRDWNTRTFDLLLLQGDTYTLTITYTGNGGGNSGSVRAYLDNISLEKQNNVDDIDTGIISNGDFIGPDFWNYSENADFVSHIGVTTTQLGAVKLPFVGESITQTNITVAETRPVTYQLSYDCDREGYYWSTITYEFYSSNTYVSQGTNCGDDWTNYTYDIVLVPEETYTLTLK